MRKKLFLTGCLLMALVHLTGSVQVHAESVPVFIYAGQSNADGREYCQNLPDYMTDNGSLPSSPYTHLQWASICGNPSRQDFGTRTFNSGERYAFCDVTNYWIDQAVTSDFYAIKCAYGGTAIAPGVTAEKLPIWYADAEWMQTHYAYKGDDITKAEYANYNSLTKNLTEGVASLIDGTLAAIDAGYDVKAILWHQGESDRNASDQYYTNFKTMIAYMRNAVYQKTGDENDLTLPFIFGTVCRRSTQYNAGVEAAQRQVAQEDANVYLIDMQNATLLSDNLHFDRQATEYLGKKMYNQLVTLGLVPNGSVIDVEEFAVEESPMDNVAVPSPDNRSWDFSSFSEATLNALSANVTSSQDWNSASGWGYRYGHQLNVEQLMVSETLIPETEGLYFSSAQSNRVCILSNWLGFRTSDATVYIPKLTAGQLVTFTLRGASGTANVNPDLDTQSLVELVSDSKTVGTTVGTVTYRVRYNVTLPTHMGFTMGGAYVQKIEVKTPETVNILIGADQKETFSCNQPLDFSPFVDLFKAYVVTGYDDATGVVDCEQVLQVPANTGVLLIGEESTVNAPIVEGDAPAAPATNLLTAVVGSGSAPAGSYVLTTSAGVTQFTRATNAVALNNQAYIASLGANDAYGFNTMAAKTEHVYDIAGGNILAKGTKLTFTDVEHHTMSNGKKVYGPANAIGLDGRFAFDNSGNWIVESSGQLGQTYGSNPYMSVVDLVNGDRVQFTTMNGSLKTVNAVLRGVAAGTALASGTTYVVEAPEGEKVNLDLQLIRSSNRNGFTKAVVWTSTETTPIYAVDKPTATVELQQISEGLYKAVATLSAANDDNAAITYYYKGGSITDWTVLEGFAFEPTEKAEYQFKATAAGYADSEVLSLSLGYRYALTKTVVDLTDETVFTEATKDESGFNWANANYVKISGLPADQVFGRIKSATAIPGIAVQNSNLDARYSYAKGIGLACNYGYWVKTTTATAYDFAEYEMYDVNTAEIHTTKVMVYNPNNTEYVFRPLKAVRLYEPVELTDVSIAKYDAGRKAAVSYTFDDGIQDQYTLAYPEMKKRGIRATFGIIGSKVGGTISATNSPDVPAMTWDQIREMHADGFEIANHGYNHKSLTSLGDNWQAEVTMNDDLIEQETGQRPLTFIYPYNAKNDEIVSWVESTHVGSRTSQTSMGGSTNQLTMNAYVDGLINDGSWGVTMTHSIAEGYDHFQDPQRLYSHWDYVVTLQDELWVAPFCEVAAYVKERDNATVTTTAENSETIVLTVSTTLDPTMFRQPLTLLVDTYADSATQDGNALTVKYKNGQTIVCGVNPNGGAVTIHKSADAPLPEQSKPVVSLSLTDYTKNAQLRQAIVTLSGGASSATYYYKGGNATDWTVLEGSAFEPAKKGVYMFKAVADGYADSEPTRGVALAPLYKAVKTIDLTDLDLYASVTNGTGAFSWGDNWGFDANQEFGTLSTVNVGDLSVENKGTITARYSYAKGIGLANNYGYCYAVSVGSPYSFAEYQLYQNHSLSDITTTTVHNPTTVACTFPSQKNGALKGATIYEPATVSITVADIGYATFSSNQAVDFTDSDMKAYYATQDGDNVKFDNAITTPAANTGLLLKAVPGSYEIPLVFEGEDVSTQNLLQPCLTEKTVGVTPGCDYGKVYILSKHDGRLGFYKSNNGRTLQAGKSYLYIENPSQARIDGGFPFDDNATIIEKVAVKSEKDATAHYYDLLGRRVARTEGFRIVDGKKTIVGK